MALKSTIYKATVQITDMDRNYYHDHQLTIARHPSENSERMMVRLLAFVLYADEALQFTKGLSTESEPDLWQKSLSDEIELWIDLGQPDEKRIRKACGRAREVTILTYQYRSALMWWEQNRNKLNRFNNLSVIALTDEVVTAMGLVARRAMQLQFTIQDGHIWMTDGEASVEIVPEILMRAS